MSEEEEERQPSDYKVFVDSCDGYVGSAVARFLAKRGYTVFGYGNSAPCPQVTLVESRKEGILKAELSVFEMIEDIAAVEEALEIVNTNPLHRKISIVIFSTLLTWGARTFPKEEEEEDKDEEKPESVNGEEEEEEEDAEPQQPIVEEEYLTRVPLDQVKDQYRMECRALQLNEELERLTVYIFGVGLLYGLGEHIMFPFFRQLWECKADTFPSSKAHISCMNVENLGLAVKQLLETPPDEENEHPPYYILSEQQCPTLRAIGKAFSRVLSDGKTSELDADIPELHKLILTTELASESTFLAEADEEELHCAAGIIDSAAKVVDEFREKYHLEPLKVLVIGPPASGYEEVAKRISERMGTPFVDPVALVDDAKKETSEFGDEIREMLEENEGKVTDEIICKVAHKRMAKRDCRNYGWVMSGYCDSVEKAQQIYDVGEEEEPSPHFEHIPTHVIVLEGKTALSELYTAEQIQQFTKQLEGSVGYYSHKREL